MTVIISGDNGVSDVDGSAGTPAIRGTDTNSGIFFGADQVGVATNGVERVEFGNSETVFNDGGADVDFRVEGDTDANLLFVDASTDRVGIGTSTPSQKFTVNGIIASARSGSTAALVSLTNDNNSWNLTTGTSTAQFRIDNNLLGTALSINSSNNLDVTSGTFSAIGVYNNTTASAANVHVSSAGGLFFRSTSSIKYKRDIQDAAHGLAEVMQLRPVTYRGKSENDGETVFGGLIAEEVYDAGLTEFVQYAEDGTPDALAYGNMVSLAFKAIQELKAINDAQASRIETLEAKVAALEGAE